MTYQTWPGSADRRTPAHGDCSRCDAAGVLLFRLNRLERLAHVDDTHVCSPCLIDVLDAQETDYAAVADTLSTFSVGLVGQLFRMVDNTAQLRALLQPAAATITPAEETADA